MRTKRDRAVEQVPEWEALRALASAIKEHTLSRLDEYLELFEKAAVANGIKVHWARDAAEHNRIVHEILSSRCVTRLVKSKSMLTEECGLNAYLEEHGVDVVDTDLGERIVQLRKEAPSHIVMPASHLTKEEIGETFAEHLGTPVGLSDPTEITGAARIHLREKFLAAHAAMTGVNFALRRREASSLHERRQRGSRYGARAHPHREHGHREARSSARRSSRCFSESSRAVRPGNA